MPPPPVPPKSLAMEPWIDCSEVQLWLQDNSEKILNISLIPHPRISAIHACFLSNTNQSRDTAHGRFFFKGKHIKRTCRAGHLTPSHGKPILRVLGTSGQVPRYPPMLVPSLCIPWCQRAAVPWQLRLVSPVTQSPSIHRVWTNAPFSWRAFLNSRLSIFCCCMYR